MCKISVLKIFFSSYITGDQFFNFYLDKEDDNGFLEVPGDCFSKYRYLFSQPCWTKNSRNALI